MKSVLVVATSWRQIHRYALLNVLDRYLAEYSDCNLQFLLAVNYPFAYEKPFIKVISEFKRADHCWAAKKYLHEHYQEFDYIIEGDDDIFVPRRGLEYYIQTSEHLEANCNTPMDYIPGLLAYETAPSLRNNIVSEPKLVNLTRKDVKKVLKIGDRLFADIEYVHNGCYVVDRARLKSAIDRGLGITPMAKGIYNVQDYARTGLYLDYYKKIVGIEDIRSNAALVNHISNTYYLRRPLAPTAEELYVHITERLKLQS